jgi:protein-disulfide isomerase
MCDQGRLPTGVEVRGLMTSPLRAEWPKGGVMFVAEGGVDLKTGRPVAQPKKGVLVCVKDRGATSDSVGSFHWGPADAPVVLFEYSDMQCPYCSRLSTTLKALKELYPSQLRVEYRAFPLPMHKNADAAHRAVLAAGFQGRFTPMRDTLFEEQKTWSHLPNPKEYFLEVALELGCDRERFISDYEGAEIRAVVDRELAEGRAKQVTGTPASFINGEKLSGSRPLDAFVEAVDKALR